MENNYKIGLILIVIGYISILSALIIPYASFLSILNYSYYDLSNILPYIFFFVFIAGLILIPIGIILQNMRLIELITVKLRNFLKNQLKWQEKYYMKDMLKERLQRKNLKI